MSFVYRIQMEGVNATGPAFQEVQQALGGLQQSTYQFSLTSKRAVEEGFDFSKAIRGFRQVAGLGIVLDIQMNRIAVAYNILESAQDRYTRAVDRYGASSYQATQAGRQLERIQNYVHRAQLRAYASTISLTAATILNTGVLSAQNRALIIGAARQAYHTVVDSLRTAGIWAQVQALIALHSLTPAGWGMLAVGAGVATGAIGTYAAMGGFAGRGSFTFGETNILMQGSSEEELRSQLNKHTEEVVEDVTRFEK